MMSNAKMWVISCWMVSASLSGGRSMGRVSRPAAGLGEGEDAFGEEARVQVGLLELRPGLVEDERDGMRQLVLEPRGELLVGALQVRGDPGEVLLELGVVVDLEVGALVDPPGEGVVLDLVLAVVGDEP